MKNQQWKEIAHFIFKVRCRIAVNLFFDHALKGLTVGSVLALGLTAISVFVPWYDVWQYALAAVAGGFLIGCICFLFHFPTKHQSALIADRAGLSEMLVTALEYQEKDDIFSNLQRKKTAETIKDFPLKAAVPRHFPWRTAMMFCFVCAAAAGLLFVPSAARKQARHIQASEVMKEQFVKALDERQKDIADKEELSTEQKVLLEKLLADIRHDLAKADLKSPEDIVSAYERAVKKLSKQLSQTKSEAVAQALTETAAGLNDAAVKAQSLAENILTSPTDQEAQKALASMTENQMFADAGQLSENSGEDGDVAGGQSESQTPGTGQNNGESQSPPSDSGQSNGEGSKSSSGAGQNSGKEPTSSSASGQNNGGGQNQNSGAGSGQGNSGNNGNNGNNGNTGLGASYGSRTGSKTQEGQLNGEKIHIPDYELLTGDDDQLTGKKNGEAALKAPSDQVLTWAGEYVDYGQVIADYSQNAYIQLEQSSIPSAMKEMIKSYFNELNE